MDISGKVIFFSKEGRKPTWTTNTSQTDELLLRIQGMKLPTRGSHERIIPKLRGPRNLISEMPLDKDKKEKR